MEFMSPSIGNLAAALAAAQAEMKPASKNATNPFLKNKYADLQSCFEACNSVLPKHKLAISQIVIPAEAGHISVQTMLMHESGEWISSVCTLPCPVPLGSNGKPSVNAAQAAGSAITYARRYGLTAIVGLATDDDDGNAAGQPIQPQAQRPAPKPVPAPKPAPTKPAPAPAQAPQQEGELDTNQRKALMARINEVLNPQKDPQRKIEREEYLRYLSTILGREVLSSKTLTIDEFHKFMAATKAATEIDQPPF